MTVIFFSVPKAIKKLEANRGTLVEFLNAAEDVKKDDR